MNKLQRGYKGGSARVYLLSLGSQESFVALEIPELSSKRQVDVSQTHKEGKPLKVKGAC